MRSEMHLSLLVALLVFAVRGLPSRGDICSPGPGKEGPQHRLYTYHRLSEGDPLDLRCCLRQECNAGQYAEPCSEDDIDSTTCKPCPAGKWLADNHFSDDFHQCQHWSPCLAKIGLEVKENGSSVHDSQCQCMLHKGFYPGAIYCAYTELLCDEGKELNNRGHCVLCPANTYKLVNGYGPCSPCPNTEQKLVAGPGRCTPCPPGTKNLLGYGCQTCEELYGHKVDHKDCHQNGTVVTPIPVKQNPHKEREVSNVLYIVMGLVVSVLIIIIVIISLVVYLRRRRKRSSDKSGITGTEPQQVPSDDGSVKSLPSTTASTLTTHSEKSFECDPNESEKQPIGQYQHIGSPGQTTFINAKYAIIGSNNAVNNNCDHNPTGVPMSGENFAYPGNDSRDGSMPQNTGSEC